MGGDAAQILDSLKTEDRKSIALLSLNPAVDITYDVPRLVPDQKVHAQATRYDPGGNGINVARSLKRLGVTPFHICVTAGDIGSFLKGLLRGKVGPIDYVAVEGETRINGTVLEREAGNQYEVSGIGPVIQHDILDAILTRYLEQAQQGIGVLTGSTPACVDEDLYAQLIPRIQQSEGMAVVDSHDAPLRHALQAKPFLIKPNRFEFEKLMNRKLPRLTDVADAAREVCASGVKIVCVSLGGQGVLAASDGGVMLAQAPQVKVDSTVGAGDSMVGGLVAALAAGLGIRQALMLGVACGAGTVQHPGTELFRYEDVLTLLPKVKTEYL